MNLSFRKHFERIKYEEWNNNEENIGNDTRHCEIVEFLASAFSDREVIEKTGYCFLGLEPLEAYASEIKGKKTFDLVIGNAPERRLLLIEVKTTQAMNQSRMTIPKVMKKKIEFVEQNFGLLAKNLSLDFKLDEDSVEYICCLEKGPAVRGLNESISKKKSEEEDDPRASIIVWSVSFKDKRGSEEDRNRILLLEKPNTHESNELNDLLYNGVNKKDIVGKVSIPFLLTSHAWIVLYKTVVELICDESKRRDAANIKKLSLKEMKRYAARVAAAGAIAPDALSQKKAEKVVDIAVAHGVEYKMLRVNGDEVTLICKGTRKDSIIHHFEKKYRGYNDEKRGTYAEERAREEAIRLAVEEYDKGIKRLDEYE